MPRVLHQEALGSQALSQGPKAVHILSIFFFFFFVISLFRAAPAAYGGSQVRGQIGAIAAGLHHSHNNVGSELRLQPTPQLTAMWDP